MAHESKDCPFCRGEFIRPGAAFAIESPRLCRGQVAWLNLFITRFDVFYGSFKMLVSFSAVSGICKLNRFMQMFHARLNMSLCRPICYLNGLFSMFYGLSRMLGKYLNLPMLSFC